MDMNDLTNAAFAGLDDVFGWFADKWWRGLMLAMSIGGLIGLLVSTVM